MPVGVLDRFLEPPGGATPDERHNFRVAYRESALIGFISAAGTFLPVFVARLGGSNLQVSLVTALPSLTGVILAIPLGGLIQSRRNIIPWYSRGRLGNQLGYVVIAVAAFALPTALVVPGILGIWAVVTIFSAVTSVSFAVVMDATAGGRGRYELMSRRWSILGLMNALSLVLVGQALGWLTFPTNYQVIFAGLGLLGIVAYRYAAAIRVPDHPPTTHPAGARRLANLTAVIARVRAQPAFLGFTARHFVYAIGASIAVPLVPLFYVRVIGAPDAWIGLIGTTQALMLLVGYALWRRASRARGSRFVLIWSTIGAAIAPAALALTRDVAVAAAIAGVGAVFTAGVNLAIFDRMMSIVPRGYGVTFTSFDTSVVYLAGIIGPLVAATLADHLGLAMALGIAAAATLFGALLFAIDHFPRPIRRPDPAGERVAAAGGSEEAAG
jgi:MFS family permease